MTKFILGCDPGLSGAVAFYIPEAPMRVGVDDMPVVNGSVDPNTLARMIQRLGPTIAVVELVASRPKQGVSSVFKFGDAFGCLRGVLGACQIPIVYVTPQKWKKHFNLIGGPEGKEQARALALQRFSKTPDHFARKKDHGRAEAALLALWYEETRQVAI